MVEVQVRVCGASGGRTRFGQGTHAVAAWRRWSVSCRQKRSHDSALSGKSRRSWNFGCVWYGSSKACGMRAGRLGGG